MGCESWVEELLIEFCNFANQCKVGSVPKRATIFCRCRCFRPRLPVGGGGIMSRNLEPHFHPHLAPRATVVWHTSRKIQKKMQKIQQWATGAWSHISIIIWRLEQALSETRNSKWQNVKLGFKGQGHFFLCVLSPWCPSLTLTMKWFKREKKQKFSH